MILSKFKSLDNLCHIAEIIDEKLIYFSPLFILNDKDEAIVSRSLAMSTWPMLGQIPKIGDPEPFVFSLSAISLDSNKIERMRSEYGSICIVFEYDFEKGQQFTLSEVKYLNESDYAQLKSRKNIAGGYLKSMDWSYEKEFRLISTAAGISSKGHHHHLLENSGLTIKRVEFSPQDKNHEKFQELMVLCEKNQLECIERA